MTDRTERAGLVAAALAYANGDFPVFPLHSITLTGQCTCNNHDCSSQGKHPRTAHGVTDATCDHNQIETWWTDWPDANIGVACGYLYVVDVDGERGAQTWRDLCNLNGGEPATRTVRTGNGRHLWFVTDLPLGNSSGRLGPSIDTRGRGGYVVAPPSIHAAGGGTLYSWENPGSTLARLPKWIVDQLQRPDLHVVRNHTTQTSTDELAEKRLQAAAGTVAMAQEGQRNDTLNWAAYRAGQIVGVNALDPERALDVLLTAAARAGLAETESRKTIASGINAGIADPDHTPTRTADPAAPPATTIHNAPTATATTTATDDGPVLTWHQRVQQTARTGHDFLNASQGPIPAIWGNGNEVAWAQGEGLLVAGPAGVGKTTIVQQVVTGLLGHPDHQTVLGLALHNTPRRVLYLALDRPRQIGRSLARMLKTDDDCLDNLTVWDRDLPFDPATDRQALTAMADTLECDVIVIDSIYDLSPSIVKPEVAGEVVRTIKVAVNNGIDVVGIHHPRKQPTGAKSTRPSLDDLYGGMQLGAGFGSVLYVKGRPGDDQVDLIHLKQPGEVIGPLAVTHNHEVGRSTIEGVVDLVSFAISHGSVDVARAAIEMAPDGLADRALRERARRRLEGHVRAGVLKVSDSGPGTPTVYVPVVPTTLHEGMEVPI